MQVLKETAIKKKALPRELVSLRGLLLAVWREAIVGLVGSYIWRLVGLLWGRGEVAMYAGKKIWLWDGQI